MMRDLRRGRSFACPILGDAMGNHKGLPVQWGDDVL